MRTNGITCAFGQCGHYLVAYGTDEEISREMQKEKNTYRPISNAILL